MSLFQTVSLAGRDPNSNPLCRAWLSMVVAILTLGLALMVSGGCAGAGRGASATDLDSGRAYPYSAAILDPIEVMVYRTGARVELVNHTVRSFDGFDLWLNERYLKRVPGLQAGQTVTMSLHEFVDEYGEPFRAGGLLATRKSEPLSKAEIETDEGLIGLLVVPLERQ